MKKATQQSTGKQLRSQLQHHREMAADSLQRLWRAPLASLMTVTVIGIALLLPALLSYTLSNISGLGSGLNNINQITLYLQDDLSAARLAEIQTELRAHPTVRDLTYISAQQALDEFSVNSGFGDVITELGSNPLPAALTIYPVVTDAAQIDLLLQDLQTLPEVEFAQLDLHWLQRLQAIMSLFERAVVALTLILGIAVLFVVGNTIRMAIEGRRAEILVVKLVGGSNSFVARPFLYTGFWYGFCGGLFAWLGLLLLLLLFAGPVTRLLALYGGEFSLQYPGLGAGLLLCGGGALLGWLGAVVSVHQHLSAIEPR